MRTLVTKSEIKKVSLKELRDYELAPFQRWKNDKNVEDLISSLKQIGQRRNILVCELPNGRKLITDGNHLLNAMEELNYKNAYIDLVQVESEIDAFNLFIQFNTKGKSITALDHVVSRSTFSDNNPYRTVLFDVLDSPRNEKEAKRIIERHKLFTLSAVLEIFIGKADKVKKGEGKLIRNFHRMNALYKYINKNYIYKSEIKELTSKQATKSRKLNGGSIIPIMTILSSNTYNNLGNTQVLDLLVEFTLWFNKKYSEIDFNKDNVAKVFKTFLIEKGL